MRCLVCGGRDFDDRTLIYNTLYDLSELKDENDNWLPSDIEIISGAAPGADSIALDWAVVNWCQFYEFPADWAKYGKAAGPIRNQQMIDEGKPDLVIAFRGGRGTADMIRRARKAGIEVREIN